MQCVYCKSEWVILLLEKSDFLLNWPRLNIFCVWNVMSFICPVIGMLYFEDK
jgi:hypothetical protein